MVFMVQRKVLAVSEGKQKGDKFPKPEEPHPPKNWFACISGQTLLAQIF